MLVTPSKKKKKICFPRDHIQGPIIQLCPFFDHFCLLFLSESNICPWHVRLLHLHHVLNFLLHVHHHHHLLLFNRAAASVNPVPVPGTAAGPSAPSSAPTCAAGCAASKQHHHRHDQAQRRWANLFVYLTAHTHHVYLRMTCVNTCSTNFRVCESLFSCLLANRALDLSLLMFHWKFDYFLVTFW